MLTSVDASQAVTISLARDVDGTTLDPMFDMLNEGNQSE